MSDTSFSPAPWRFRLARGLMVSNACDMASRQSVNFIVDTSAVVLVGASATQIGLLNAAGTVGFFLLGIPLGVYVDRRDARSLLMRVALVRALVIALLAWTIAAGLVNFLLLAAASLLIGMTSVVSEPAQAVRAAEVVPKAVVGRLIARMYSADTLITLLLPALLGLSLALVAPQWIVVAAAAFSLAAAWALRRHRGRSRGREQCRPSQLVPTCKPAGAAGSQESLMDQIRQGMGYFRTDPVLRTLTWVSVLVNFGLAAFSSIEGILILRTLDIHISIFGLLIALGAGGGVLGSVLAEPLAKRYSRQGIIAASVCGLAAVSVLPLAAYLSPHAGLALAALGLHSALWGLLSVIEGVQIYAVIVDRVPHGVLGRVTAFRRALTMGVIPAGGILGGLVADSLGIATSIIMASLVTVAAAVMANRLRNPTKPSPTKPGLLTG